MFSRARVWECFLHLIILTFSNFRYSASLRGMLAYNCNLVSMLGSRSSGPGMGALTTVTASIVLVHTHTVLLSTQVHIWTSANSMLGEGDGRG